MQKTSIWLWSGIASVIALACMGGVSEVRAAAASRSMMGGESRSTTTSARMPTMPTMSINTVGTHAISGVSVPAVPTPTPTPNPNPNPNPNPDPEPEPEPSSDCPDGGVRNSEFTVDDCMQSILNCVQGGALPNGLADLFNEDMRHSVINGMGLCASQVDKCIRDVRLDCNNVYEVSRDVWLDFNSRIVQPEYYNFVLRKTGLTPRQAENVCGLLDKNTYGRSFAAVSASDNVTSEYNQTVNAYNNQSDVAKANPLGPTENTTENGNLYGVDGERGHYARWDATNAACKIRVAAYNKDKLITNNWLFGALGDDKAAEVWQDAGSTFTCNKDLFDFSLLNKTKTTAVVGIGGGTLLGAGIGALAGHGAKTLDCTNKDSREAFYNALKKSEQYSLLKEYVAMPAAVSEFNASKCKEVLNLYTTASELRELVKSCNDSITTCKVLDEGGDVVYVLKQCSDFDSDKFQLNGNKVSIRQEGDSEFTEYTFTGKNKANLTELLSCMDSCKDKDPDDEPKFVCRFKPLKTIVTTEADRMLENKKEALTCSGGYGCQDREKAGKEAEEVLNNIFDDPDVKAALQGEKANRGTTTLIGAGAGAGLGGVATAITAFVERNNISCRVGDGLNTVGFGKSYTIDSLKDFYVKWNLRVADSVRPTARVTTCREWIDTCGMYTNAYECNAVEINYQRSNRNTTTLIRNACVMSEDGVCKENRPVAVSYGVCPRNGGGNGGGNRPPVDPNGPIGPIGPDAPDYPVVPIEH